MEVKFRENYAKQKLNHRNEIRTPIRFPRLVMISEIEKKIKGRDGEVLKYSCEPMRTVKRTARLIKLWKAVEVRLYPKISPSCAWVAAILGQPA